MDDFQKRQQQLALAVIEKFKSNSISLNSLVLDLEALLSHLQIDDYERFSDVLADLEVLNAILIEEKRKPNPEEQAEIMSFLTILNSLL